MFFCVSKPKTWPSGPSLNGGIKRLGVDKGVRYPYSSLAHQHQTGKTTATPLLEETAPPHRTRREVGPRLRYQILVRDHFRCRICGRSPATDPAVKLHIDHVKPWASGGETTLDNLQTLCETCNAGKADS